MKMVYTIKTAINRDKLNAYGSSSENAVVISTCHSEGDECSFFLPAVMLLNLMHGLIIKNTAIAAE